MCNHGYFYRILKFSWQWEHPENHINMQLFAHFKDVMALQGINPGMRMAVALSGGPDSTALASLVACWWSGAGFIL